MPVFTLCMMLIAFYTAVLFQFLELNLANPKEKHFQSNQRSNTNNLVLTEMPVFNSIVISHLDAMETPCITLETLVILLYSIDI